MGRSKPRTNKRPPPKPRLANANSLSNPNNLQYSPNNTGVIDDLNLSLGGAAASAVNDDFSAALSNWSANALGRLDNIPKLTQSQLTALTGAAAGIGEANFLANPSNIPPQSYNPNLPIDLPASLAALFEAKLTLDREKAKLLRMQQELKGQKEEQHELVMGHHALQQQTQAHGNGNGNGLTQAQLQSGRMKGKAVALVEEECTCGRNHAYPPSEHSECEYECEEDCDCDCHSYIDEYDDEHEHEYEYEHDHDHDHDHEQHHHHHHHHHHDHAHHHDYEHTCDHEYDDEEDPPKRPLAEDPERLDETVRELFNWIKAVVWTIEQAAIVSGRRNWSQPK
ncbi:uncharacterized protein I303_107913 [Kwoniella dejecticola CBS 10117]|uniref:Uncharacterized protein n=1 Tax=Kwoniella dejecticola CBS 10117 TaxID=1296121 RepID=A0A1A5ZW17_9TREE|nr:uncharacterized protein I303_07913 [Kwoniella dejecticola CBS 10117]OBR82000.1 hypothetical protein I303_07913 [Kwoniella dejecticola CBS 10117]